MKANAQIRLKCREKGVFLWELAEHLGMHESTFSRKIRTEFSAADTEVTGRADKPPTRHKYGFYKNILFTDEEFAKLQAEFPADYAKRIERLSEYIASTGKSYKSHLATIRSWARKDRVKAGAEQSYTLASVEDPWEVAMRGADGRV